MFAQFGSRAIQGQVGTGKGHWAAHSGQTAGGDLQAPRLNLGRSPEPAAPVADAPKAQPTATAAPAAQVMPALPQEVQAVMLNMVRHVIATGRTG